MPESSPSPAMLFTAGLSAPADRIRQRLSGTEHCCLNRRDPTVSLYTSFYRKCRFLWLLGLACLGAISEAPARDSGKAFAYVGSNLLITAEVGGSHTFILNFINLS